MLCPGAAAKAPLLMVKVETAPEEARSPRIGRPGIGRHVVIHPSRSAEGPSAWLEVLGVPVEAAQVVASLAVWRRVWCSAQHCHSPWRAVRGENLAPEPAVGHAPLVHAGHQHHNFPTEDARSECLQEVGAEGEDFG